MYYYIRGKLIFKDEQRVAVDANGVGYLINTTLTSLSQLSEVGTEVVLYTYLHVREDIMELYGFSTKEEKNIFMLLLSVSGVGPKAALSILSVLNASSFAAAVVTNDAKAIAKASGVGAKTAQRIILELKDKFSGSEILPDNMQSGGENISDSRNEAVSALVALGYNISEANEMIKKVDANLSVEEIIKKALMGL